MRKKIDERQEQEVLRIEHYAFWTLFWLLAASIPVQLILSGNVLLIAGECALLLAASLFILLACIKKGAWGIYLTPSPKSYIIAGLLACVVGTVVIAALTWGSKHMWLYILIGAVALFATAFLLAWALGAIVKKRREKLASENEE